MATNTEARAVRCPVCTAKPGQSCTYTVPTYYARNPGRVPTCRATRAALERVGKPTKRDHTMRFVQADALSAKERRAAEQAAALAPSPRTAILRANADALTAEHDTLRAWLAGNAQIFFKES